MTDILKIITANVLSLALGLLAVWLWHITAGRRRLMRFFGLTQDHALRIFIGHLGDPGAPNGPVGFEESAEARNLEGLFRSPFPDLPEQAGLARVVPTIDAQVLRGRPGDPEVNLDHSVISLGSRMSNHASALIETDLQSPVRLDLARHPWAIEIPGLSPVTSMDRGAVVRLCQAGKCFFYCFGITEPGTAAAARYLLKNWRSMSRKYEDGVPFYYLVEGRNDGQPGVVALADHALETPGRPNGLHPRP